MSSYRQKNWRRRWQKSPRDFVGCPSKLESHKRQFRQLTVRLKGVTVDQRKADTRHKIQLGGMVIKAGLGGIDAYVLLGLLLDHASTLDGPAEHARLRLIARAFAARHLR
jgi:Conjugal transfer protein TraD